LHPAILDNLGLEPALESLVAEMNSKRQMEIRFNVSGTERKLPIDINLALFRITQEALNNVWKHSRAREAAVDLEYRPNKTLLSITDNGIGFGPSAHNKGGLGLTSMRERANLIGARLRLESTTGQGTKVLVEVEGR